MPRNSQLSAQRKDRDSAGSFSPSERLRSRRLSTILTAFFALLLAGSMTLFMWRILGEAINYSAALLTKQTDVLASNLASTGAQALMLRDYVEIEQLAVNAIDFPGIDEIKYTDATGTILADVARVNSRPIVRFGGQALSVPPEAKPTRGVTEEHVIVWHPVVLGELQGWVRVSHSLSAINDLRRNMWIANAAFGATVVIIAVGVLLAWLRKPMRALQAYAAFADRLDTRAGEQLAITASSKELDQLGQALNRASTRLHDQNSAIQNAIADLERLAAFPEQTPDIVMSLNSAGALQYINPQGRNTLTAKGLSNKNYVQLLPPNYLDIIRSCQESKSVTSEIEAIFEGNPYVWTFAPLRGRDLVHCYGRDISQRKIAEDMAQAAVLEKSAAEASSQAKSMFLAAMSHEIRTPLTAIIGYADTSLDSDRTTEQRLGALRTIRSSGDHLLALINDILDFSKIEAGALDIERTNVNIFSLIGDVESIFSEQARRKGLEFGVNYEFPLPGVIVSDPVRLKQVLLNLCSNAIKFTDKGSVQIRAAFNEQNNELCICVEDTGIGMTSDQMRSVFRPFKQGDASTSRRFGGTGLGLSLSNRIVELLGGQITVRSTPAEGSTFAVYLRLGEPVHRELVGSMEDVHRTAKPDDVAPDTIQCIGRVLVAEDNITNQELIAMYLQRLGVEVVLASNGGEAVALAKERSFDLIYMDMQMPVMSGVDAVRALRQWGFSGPIVMLTANATLEDRKLCSDAGCSDFVTKPISRKKLYEIAARYLPHRSAVA